MPRGDVYSTDLRKHGHTAVEEKDPVGATVRWRRMTVFGSDE
jgi:hypothetical protein